MSSLQVSGTLRSKVTQHLEPNFARAAGIELAHSEGQMCDPFPLGHAEILRQHKSTLVDSAAGGKGLPARDAGFGLVDTHIAEMSPSWQWIQRHYHWLCIQATGGSHSVLMMMIGCASSILAGCFQICSWASGLLFVLVQALVYVVHGPVCEKHIDDLSQFVTNTSRMQLLHDAALIGKAVTDGTAKLGLTLSSKSTLLANDKSLGKLIVSHLGAEGVPICPGAAANDLGIETAGRRRKNSR